MDSTFGVNWLFVLTIVIVAAVVILKRPKVALVILGLLVLAAGAAFFVARPVVRVSSPLVVRTPQPPALPQLPQPAVIVDFGPSTQPTTQASGKDWVDDWEAFVNTAQPTQRWIRATTPAPAASEEEARAEARKQASIALGPAVISMIRGDPKSIPGSNIVITDDWIRQQVESSLQKNQFVADEYVKRIERPYGDIWTCQLLLDASPKTLAGATQNYRIAAQRKLTVTAGSWGGLLMLGVVIILLYAFLNAATKGYFVWRLRAAAVMLLLIAVLIVMAIV